RHCLAGVRLLITFVRPRRPSGSTFFRLFRLRLGRCGCRRRFSSGFNLLGFFAGDEFLFGLGEFEILALEILSGSTGLRDLFVSRSAVPAGNDSELLADRAVAKNLDGEIAVGNQALLLQAVEIDGCAIVEAIEIFDIHDVKAMSEIVVAEAALGEAAEDRRLAVLVAALDVFTGAGLGALVAAAAGFSTSAGFAATFALRLLISGRARRDVVYHAHGKSLLWHSRPRL